MKPSFIKHALLEYQYISLDRLLEDKAAGKAFHLDAKYFDQFPLIYNEPVLGPSDKAKGTVRVRTVSEDHCLSLP